MSFVKTHSKNIYLIYYPPPAIKQKKVFVCPGYPFSPSQGLFPYIYLRNIPFTTQKEPFFCVYVNMPRGAKVSARFANSIEDSIQSKSVVIDFVKFISMVNICYFCLCLNLSLFFNLYLLDLCRSSPDRFFSNFFVHISIFLH